MSKIESNGHTSPPIESPRKPFATSELRDSSQELKLLREQNAALQAEVEHLERTKAEWRNTAYQLDMQLAASQAREQQLRGALEAFAHRFPESSVAKEALAIPSDTTALEALIQKAGEVMRERCAVEAYEWDMAYVLADTAPIGNAEAIRALPVVTLSDLK